MRDLASEAHLEAWIQTERKLFAGAAVVTLLLAGYMWFFDPIRPIVLDSAQVDGRYSTAAALVTVVPITALAMSFVAVLRAFQVNRLRRQLPGINPHGQRLLGAFCFVIALLSLLSGLLFHLNAFFFLALLFFGLAGRSLWRIAQLAKLEQSA